MIIDPKCGSNTMVFVHKDFDVVIQKLGVYTELAKKFIKRNKRYQYIKHVEKLPDDKWVLVFKVLPSNHESIKEYNRIVESSKKELWINYLNAFIIG
jgi:ABC-type sulfate transport system permease subunit